MNIRTLHDCSKNKFTYDILGDLQAHIEITGNPLSLPLDSLFSMAARKNKKRSFLFVSKILGKHIPVKPQISLLAGEALAALFLKEIYQMEVEAIPVLAQWLRDQDDDTGCRLFFHEQPVSLPEKVLFIGFAETATALGHSLFHCFRDNAQFIHTTREVIPEVRSVIDFEEEHSHAVAHHCYAADPSLLAGNEPVVLVDDEMTTGNTALNIIRAIQERFPRKEYIVASLLDWRSSQDHARFLRAEKELEIRIRTLSLLTGNVSIKGQPMATEQQVLSSSENRGAGTPMIKRIKMNETCWKPTAYTSIDSQGIPNPIPYIYETGRFGISHRDRNALENSAKEWGLRLKNMRHGKRALCLGTGEFMYLPMRIASFMGEGAYFQSTTRSPIHPCNKQGYGIKNAFSFPSPDDPSIMNYVYNIPYGFYDELYLFLERDVPKDRLRPLKEQLIRLGIPRIFLLVFSGGNQSDDVD